MKINYYKNIILGISCCILFLGNVFAQTSVRTIIPLKDSWQFNFVTNVNRKHIDTIVSLPHTWNAGEVKNNKFNYQRTNGVYRKRIFIGPEWKDKRLFLYFEGANSVATVFVNKRYVGEHKGGYTKFCFEITPFIHPGENNNINVMVSNTYRLDVLPMSGDFNVYGGLHRPVSLIVTEKNCISPLDYASSGVYVTPRNIKERSADIDVRVKLSFGEKNRSLKLRTTILDTAFKVVSEQVTAVKDAVANVRHIINNPHLWNGKTDPYLYKIRVELLQNNQVIDTLAQSFGVRYFRVDPDKGFYLNGKYLDLYGVSFHEDTEGKGSAFTQFDYEKDMALINELGATALRFTHYPHGQPMYDLTDQNGVVVWTEIPFIGSGGYVGEGYANTEEFHKHAKIFLTELIRQNYNHPSIFFWGLFNELTANFDSPAPFIKELNELAHKEDPARLTTCADMLDNSPFDTLSDVKGWNRYFGWYGGNVNNISRWTDDLHKKIPKLPFAISEYGAGASIHQHSDSVVQPVPNGKFHPEEWQTFFHERYWEQFSTRPWLWAKFVWVLSDFGSTGRNEGDTIGINDKGLVTYDKQTKKDAFYFYKANWNSNQPTLYITDKRNDTRHKPVTDIKIYSTVPDVELFVNGKSLGKRSPDNFKRIVWQNVVLQNGINTIEVKAGNENEGLKDACTWELK